MKKIRIYKFGWKYMPYDKKNRVIGTAICLTLGAVLLAVGLGVLFGYVLPFEEWVYRECFYRNVDYFPVDRNHEMFIYYVDGIKYEKVLFSANRGKGVCFWYNAANPNEIIFLKDFFIVFLPILIILGVIFIICGLILYLKIKLNISKKSDK